MNSDTPEASGISPRRPSLGPSVEDVVAQLRQRIVRQDLAPGSRLRERQIADELGVSRTVIRDALSILAERQLVVRYPNRGAEVVRLGRPEIIAIYEVRVAVEGLCARLATERAPAGAWEELTVLFRSPADDAVRHHDFDLYNSFISRFDQQMIAYAANPVLADVLGTLADRSAVLARRSVFLPGRAEQGLQLHRATLQAMRIGHAAEAERSKQQNLRLARDYLLKFEGFVL